MPPCPCTVLLHLPPPPHSMIETHNNQTTNNVNLGPTFMQSKAAVYVSLKCGIQPAFRRHVHPKAGQNVEQIKEKAEFFLNYNKINPKKVKLGTPSRSQPDLRSP